MGEHFDHKCGATTCVATNNLIDELLLDVRELVCHNFARHVLELVLEHGSHVQRNRIAKAIQGNALHLAKNRNASYIVEKAIVLCSPDNVHGIVSKLLNNPEKLIKLAMHECGCHVVAAVVRLHSPFAQQLEAILGAAAERVKSTKH